MSDTTIPVESEVPAETFPAFPVPNEQGRFADADIADVIIATVGGASIDLIQTADGWLYGAYATLPEDSLSFDLDAHHQPFSTRIDAVVAACEAMINWCSAQKETGGKKHRRQATELQNWALTFEQTEGKANHDQKKNGKQATDEASLAGKEDATATEVSGEIGISRPANTPASDGPTLDARRDTPEVLYSSTSLPEGELKLIPIEELFESPLNPRQYYPEAKMVELTESMKAHGFRSWNFLVVSPREEGGYWIAAGHRRKRAADRAGLTHIPCMVRSMSDAEILDVLNFDNSNREDIHPLHEAAGWKSWMRDSGKGVLDIAKRIGQSVESVYVRLKCVDLIEEGQKKFLDGRIQLGHAVQIARLPEYYQHAAIEFCCPNFDPEQHVTVRQLREWIQGHCFLSLIDSGFDPTDPDLSWGGSCVTCPKRSGVSPELFSDLGNPDICTDPRCYRAKQSATEANKPKPEVVAPTPPVAAPDPTPAPKREPAPKRDPEPKNTITAQQKDFDKARDAESERLHAEAEADEKVYLKAVDLILEKVTWPLSTLDFQDIVAALIGLMNCQNSLADKFAIEKKHSARWQDLVAALPKLSPAKVLRIALAGILFDSIEEEGFTQSQVLVGMARRYKVDLAKIRAQVNGEIRDRLELRNLNPPAAPPADTRKDAIKKLSTLNQAPTPKKKASPPVKKKISKPAVPKKAVVKKATKPKAKGKK